MIDGYRCAIGGGQGCHLVPFAEGYPYRKLSPAHLCETIPNRLTMRVRTARCRSPLYLSCHGLRLSTCTPAQSFLRCDGEAPTIVLGWAVRDQSGLYIGLRGMRAHGMTQRQTILFHHRPPWDLRALLKSKGFRLVRVVRRGKGGAS